MQAGKLRVRFPMGIFEFFIDIALPLASNRYEYQGYLLGVKATGV
jgi:hypothetical protein